MARRQPFTSVELRRIRAAANRAPRETGYTRTYYSYPAKFLSHLPREIISRHTATGALVFDGFCGGGTTALEAMLLGRRFTGYDINPFALLIARVKTIRLGIHRLEELRGELLECDNGGKKPILDDDDRQLLGARAADEAEALAWGVDTLPEAYRDFFRLALIHCLKILGRRDFRGASVLPAFAQRSQRMIRANSTLPPGVAHRPALNLGSSHVTRLRDGEVELILTSPPYKDVDVEYMALQLQRPRLHRSKRSQVIARVLDVEPLDPELLCGGRGEVYWRNLGPSIAEARRVIADGRPAFWWAGFRRADDQERFMGLLEGSGFSPVEAIGVKLSHNRAASSRSTHHQRPTGMLQKDVLFVTVAA